MFAAVFVCMKDETRRIVDDGSNERSVSTDGEDQSSNMESWLREGRLDATKAMTGDGFFGPTVTDNRNGESDGTNQSAERGILELPARIKRVLHRYKPGACTKYSSQRSDNN